MVSLGQKLFQRIVSLLIFLLSLSRPALTGDEKALGLWSRFRDFSIKRLEETYQRLNIHFDSYNGEAAVKTERIEEAYKIMEEKGLLVEDKGAKLCDLQEYKMGRVVIKKAGESASAKSDRGAG